MIKPIINGTRVVFGPVRLSHVHLLEPQSFDGDNGNAKYSAVPLIPKTETETLNALRAAIDAAYNDGVVKKWGGRKPPFVNYPPLADGDTVNKNGEERGEEYRGKYFVNAKTKTKPGLVDRYNNAINEPEEVYSGMWALVSVSFYAYDSNGSRGVAVALNNVKKTHNDEKFGGGTSAAGDFAGIQLDEDDMDMLG